MGNGTERPLRLLRAEGTGEARRLAARQSVRRPWRREVRGRGSTWAGEAWLELEAEGACGLLPTAWPGRALDTDLDKHGHSNMQTDSTRPDAQDRHRPVAPRTDQRGHSKCHEQEATATRTREAEHTPPPGQTPRAAVGGSGHRDEHNALIPQRTHPSMTDCSPKSGSLPRVSFPTW